NLNAAITALNTRSRRESLANHPDQILLKNMEAQLKKARLDYEAFQTALYATHPDLSARRGEAPPFSIDQAASLVPDSNTAFLEYAVTERTTYLFVITGSASTPGAPSNGVSVQVYPIEINAKELARRAANFRTRLASNSADFREPAGQLYGLLISPAPPQPAGKTVICIVPDGPLWELPFQALLTRQGEFFLQSHAVFYAPSLSTLQQMIRNRARGQGAPERYEPPSVPLAIPGSSSKSSTLLFAVGNPALNSSPALPGAIRGDAYRPLPEAEQEVKTLARIYGVQHCRLLTGEEAREETVKSEIGRYRILHFATHGTFDDQSPLYSRL